MRRFGTRSGTTHAGPGIRLEWPGKDPLAAPPEPAPATELVLRERHDPGSGAASGAGAASGSEGWRDLLIRGDNLQVGAALRARLGGQVELCYLDPPYATGMEFQVARGVGGRRTVTQPAYGDAWDGGAEYLQMLYPRLRLARELLAENGSIYVHVGHLVAPYVRVMMDEIFGARRLLGEIIWKRADAHNDVGQGARRYGAIHDTVLSYARGSRPVFQPQYAPLPDSTVQRWYRHVEAGTGRRYNRADLTARKPGGDTSYEWRGVRPPPGRYWAYSRRRMEELEQQGRLVYSARGTPYLKRYLDESRGVPLQDVWTDIPMLRGISAQRSGYPTEKPEALLLRILSVSSTPAGLVLDLFCGSGTTLMAAARLGRRFIGCDAGGAAIHTSRKRLLGLGAAFDVLELADGTAGSGSAGPGPAAPGSAAAGSAAAGRVTAGLVADADGVRVELRGYAPPPEVAADGARWEDLVDYWAVDFAGGGVFAPSFYAARGRGGLNLLSTPREPTGIRRVVVQLVDVYGHAAWTLLECSHAG